MNRRTFTKGAGLTALSAFEGQFRFAGAAPLPSAPASPSGDLSTWDVYRLGSSYYPEWWDPREWEQDFAGMQALGLNTVRMGEFAWSSFEPEQGKFIFDWMDHAVEIANRHGIKVLLGTPTAAVPPWLYALHPDVLGANALGPYTYGGRKGYCTNSANYLDACARIVEALAQHYGNHSGVIGWQLDNEPGIPFQCFDANCERAFQQWLARRYGSLDALNRSWNGAFWSNHYTDWTQIHFPKNSGEGGWQPAISLDYRKFFSDSYSSHLRRQAEILRRHVKDQFIYTNWPSTTWSVDVYKAGAEFLDATAWDNYVSAPGLSEFQHQYIASMNNDIARCASRGQRFFCAEQIAYLPPLAHPDGLRLQAYLNLAHGCKGHLYFEWRRPTAGNEQSRPSFIKGFDGKLTPQGPILARIGREFAELGPKLANATTTSDVAMLYDFTNEFAQGFWSVGTPGDRYDSEASRFYVGLKSLQRNIDAVPLSADLSGYRIVAAPNLRLIDDRDADKLKSYVADGGVLVLTDRAGTQHTDCSMRRILSPGLFTEIGGVASVAKLDLMEYSTAHSQMDTAHEAELGIAFTGSNLIFKPRTIMEQLELRGAEAMATFRGGRMDGWPAVTRCRYKKGWVIYAGTDSEDHGFHESVAQLAADAARLPALLIVPRGVAVTTREDARHRYYFVLNLTETVHSAIPLQQPMEDLASGGKRLTSLRLEPLGVALLATEKGPQNASREMPKPFPANDAGETRS
jgi:beta-galactosidase